MHKKILAMILAGMMVLGTACASAKEKEPVQEAPAQEEAEAQETEEAEPAEDENAWKFAVDPVEELQDEKTYHIGIVEQADHPAIAHAVEKFQEDLSARLGDDVSYEIRCINNDEDACAAIVTQFMSGSWDLVLTAGTMPTKMAADASTGTPVVGICVTDFIVADIIKSNAEPGGYCSGSSCLPSMHDAWEMLKYVNPSGEKVGIVYSEDEVGGAYMYEILRLYVEEEKGGWYDIEGGNEDFDIEDYLKVYTVGKDDDLRAVLDRADAECGPIFLPCDNKIACQMDVVREFTLDTHTPTIAADANMCIAGTLGSVSVSYYTQGSNGAEMAWEVLTGEYEIGMDSVYEMAYSSYSGYNPEIAEELNLYIWTAQALNLPSDED